MEKIKLSFLGLLFILPISTSQAETNQYNVEIVIFEDRSNHYINSEQWPVIHPLVQIPATEITAPVTDIFSDIEVESIAKAVQAAYPENNSVINITHNESYALADHVNKLKRSSRYNILLHQSWQQTGLNETNAINIQLDNIEAKNTGNKNLATFNSSNSISKISKKSPKSSIQGTFKLILGRYLHIHTDLLYKRLDNTYKPNSPVVNDKTFREFQIRTQRRMRSRELHYIDHPLLGILVLATPIEQSEPSQKHERLK